MDGDQTILLPPPDAEERMRKGGKGNDGQKIFAFDRSYWSFDRNDKNFAGQDSLYSDLGIPLLDNAVRCPLANDFSQIPEYWCPSMLTTHNPSFKDTTIASSLTARRDLESRTV